MSAAAPVFLTAPTLASAGVRHAFFTRQGGASAGLYSSLNGGTGSKDDPAAVAENRARMARVLGVTPERLLVPFQIHSADAVAVTQPWPAGERPRVDGIVTAARGLALGVTGADCGTILFADPRSGIIGAAHAGWGGALGGVLEATIAAMERLGARRDAILTALGPTIGPRSYEVGPEYRDRFLAADAAHARIFGKRYRWRSGCIL